MSFWRKGNEPRAASQKEKVEDLFIIVHGNFMIISWFLLSRLIHAGLKKKNLNLKIVFSDVVFSKDKTKMVHLISS